MNTSEGLHITNPKEVEQERPKRLIVFEFPEDVPFVAPFDGIFSFYKKKWALFLRLMVC